MKITKSTIGWHFRPEASIESVPSALIIVEFQNDGDAPTYDAYVVLCRVTGKTRMPTYFRCPEKSVVRTPPPKFEDCIVPDPNVKHTAYRKTGDNTYEAYEFTGRYSPVAGEGLEFPVETRLEIEDAARKFAIEKGLVNANRSS